MSGWWACWGLLRTAGHTVRTQHGVTASAGQRRGDVEIRNYMRDQAGSRSLVFDLSITHDRYCSGSHVQQNCLLSYVTSMSLYVLLRRAKSTAIGNNQNISFVHNSPCHSLHVHPHDLRVFASSFSTSPPGDRDTLMMMQLPFICSYRNKNEKPATGISS